MPALIQPVIDFFTHLPWPGFVNWDTGLVLILLGFSLVYTLFLGRQRVLLILISIYVALGVLAYTPLVGRVSDVVISPNKQIYFAIGFFILFFLLVRGVLGQIFHKGGQISGWWQIFFLAFLQMGLITSIAFSFLSQAVLNNFSPFLKIVFLNDWARFVWLFLPIFIMAALARKEED